jgi:hypothetical protein
MLSLKGETWPGLKGEINYRIKPSELSTLAVATI